jgi:hypothetical protein
MGTKDPRIDAYIAKSADFGRPILSHLRSLVHKAVPDVQETMKWNFPHFDYKGMLCSMASFKQHCAFGFWKEKLLLGTNPGSKHGMGSFGKITSLRDLPTDSRLIRLIKKAAELNDAGVKVARGRSTEKKPLRIPAFFKGALRRNKKALATFTNFTYSHKKEYVEWVTKAKSEETRSKRLATAIEWMAKGKPRNWKYIR